MFGSISNNAYSFICRPDIRPLWNNFVGGFFTQLTLHRKAGSAVCRPMDEESSGCKPDSGNSWLRRLMRKTLPHKPTRRLCSKHMCCDFKLDLRPLNYDVINRGVRVSYPQQRTPAFVDSVPFEQQKGMLTVWQPYLRRFCDIFIPRVYASGTEVIMDKQEAETNVYETLEEKRSEAMRIFREQYELGKPIEEIVEEYLSKETGWDRLREFYGYYEGYVLRPFTLCDLFLLLMCCTGTGM